MGKEKMLSFIKSWTQPCEILTYQLIHTACSYRQLNFNFLPVIVYKCGGFPDMYFVLFQLVILISAFYLVLLSLSFSPRPAFV